MPAALFVSDGRSQGHKAMLAQLLHMRRCPTEWLQFSRWSGSITGGPCFGWSSVLGLTSLGQPDWAVDRFGSAGLGPTLISRHGCSGSAAVGNGRRSEIGGGRRWSAVGTRRSVVGGGWRRSAVGSGQSTVDGRRSAALMFGAMQRPAVGCRLTGGGPLLFGNLS